MAHKIEQTAYQAAREGAAVSELTGWGWLRLTGRDRLDLLHRLSTNAVKNLAPGAGAVTVLTSPVGRVMAVVNAYAGENEAYLRTMPPQAAGVTRYLSSMIFWQDQVEVANLAEQRGQLALYGPQARDTLERLTGADLAGVPEYGWSSAAISGAAVALLRGGPLEPAAWIVVAPVDAVDAIRQAFAGLPALDPQTVEVLRVEAGLPLWGRELNDDVTPLETGLLPAINFNKGCYTGQEVIARQTNYDKVTRNLVGLEFAAEDAGFVAQAGYPGGDQPWGRVRGPGRGGFVGSVAYSPRLRKSIALAIAPRDLAQAGTEVEVERDDRVLKATVRSLPFALE